MFLLHTSVPLSPQTQAFRRISDEVQGRTNCFFIVGIKSPTQALLGQFPAFVDPPTRCPPPLSPWSGGCAWSQMGRSGKSLQVSVSRPGEQGL